MYVLSCLQQTLAGKGFMLALFVLSFCGYTFFFSIKGINKSLTPGLTIATIMCLEYTAGILNMLPLITVLIFLSGLGLFCYSTIHLVRHREQGRQVLRHYPFWFLSLIGLLALIRFRGTCLVAYDDFSHWGTFAKCMLVNDRLPISTDTQIMFQSYPPATGLLLYYFTKIVGLGEAGMVFIHYFSKLCFLSSLYFIGEKCRLNKILAYGILSVGILLLSIYNVTSLCLGVDQVLASCGVFCLVSAFASQIGKDRFQMLMPVLGATACVMIKNSGIFFYAMSFAAIICLAIKQRRFKTSLRDLAWMLVPIAVIYIWQRHVQLVFPAGLDAKHTMTVAHAKGVISQKTWEEISIELRLISGCITNPRSNRTLILWLGAIICSIPLFVLNGKANDRVKSAAKYLLFFLVFSIIYEIGTLAMYLFSMPHKEILYQNGDDYLRYNGTLDIFLSAGLICYVCCTLDCLNNRHVTALCALVTAVLLGVALYPRIHLEDLNPTVHAHLYYMEHTPVKLELQAMLDELKSQPEGDCLVRVDASHNVANYTFYMMRYMTQDTNFEIYVQDDVSDFDAYWRDEATQAYCLDTVNHCILYR